MLSIKDVVSLAKAGYKPADVKELIELSKEEPKEEAPAAATTAAVEENKEPENDTAPAVSGKPAQPDPVDYKAKYEELLEANRKAALTRDNSGSEPQQKTAEEIVNEALIGLLS